MKFQTLHFVVLTLILSIGAIGLSLTQGNDQIQLFIGVLTSLAYIIWGILHHSVLQDLHPKVVIEYTLIGVIAIVLFIIFLGV